MKKIIFLSEQDFTSWIKNDKWRIEHFISEDSFFKGKFLITEINPYITYKDFSYLRPLFVEVELNEKEEWSSLTDITAFYCQQQYFNIQQDLINERFGNTSHIQITKWPTEVKEVVTEWMVDSEYSDALTGGERITEMLFAQLYNPSDLKQWIRNKQKGSGVDLTQSHLCHVLQYEREHTETGILGAVADLGCSIKNLVSTDNNIKIINDILRPIVKEKNSQKSDFEILNNIRQEICSNSELTTLWKALVCPFILYFAMKKSGVISERTVKIEICQQFINQWINYGFVYEIKEACRLLGFQANASNFSKLYREWTAQRKETLSNKEACFQKSDKPISSPIKQNIPMENVSTKNHLTKIENTNIKQESIKRLCNPSEQEASNAHARVITITPERTQPDISENEYSNSVQVGKTSQTRSKTKETSGEKSTQSPKKSRRNQGKKKSNSSQASKDNTAELFPTNAE